MSQPLQRFIAVDWSGDRTSSGQRKKIWIADWHSGRVSLQSGMNRQKTTEYLAEAAGESKHLVVGLDFAFSFPAWFVNERASRDAEEFWRVVKSEGETWLSEPHPHFWGKSKGSCCPPGHHQLDGLGFRVTERALLRNRGKGLQPKSAFKIGGAGSVGTGSVRGIPYLLDLKRAGFSVWPFDSPLLPLAVEIYPRLFTGNTVTSQGSARGAHLAHPRYRDIPEEIRANAQNSEDAFDALCSVVGMKEHGEEFANLAQETDPTLKLEGRIWCPRSTGNGGL